MEEKTISDDIYDAFITISIAVGYSLLLEKYITPKLELNIMEKAIVVTGASIITRELLVMREDVEEYVDNSTTICNFNFIKIYEFLKT